jgi:AcrR family transcriptional regulator
MVEDETAVDGRRTDTKQRIRDVALDVFGERGWESATLREIAERIGITRPALYYHYDSKEAILASIHDDLAGSVDHIIAAARSEPRTAATRVALLRQVADLVSGDWGAFVRFAQREERAMRDLKGAAGFAERMDALANLLQPDGSIASQISARLALDAILMASARDSHLGGTQTERNAAALQIATQLIDRTP